MTITHLHLLPLSTFILLPATFIISYTISILLRHVEVDFPYISDTGTLNPESNVFGQLLNMEVFLILGSMYVRFKQVQQFYRDHLSSESEKIQRWNSVSLWVGILSALGLSLVANFQETAILEVHLVGAAMVFGFGTVYIWIQTVMSYHMHPLLNSLLVARLRLVLAIISTLGFLNTAIFAGISLRKFHGTNKRKWYPNDGGFPEHVVSAVSEWITSLAFCFFFLTYVKEFQLIILESPKVYFLTSEEHGLPTTDIYSSDDQVEITHSQRDNSSIDNSLLDSRTISQQVTAVIH